jgi:pilus assembly protein CpaB
MGDRRFTVVLAVALLVAAVAGFGVFRLLQKAQTDAQTPTRAIVVAAKDLSEGHVVVAEDITSRAVAVDLIPAGAFTTVGSVVGRVTRIAVFTGEVIVPGRLAPTGAGAGLEIKIAPGKRAMAVRIDDVAGVSGLIQPNSRVDVLVTLRDGSGEQQRAKLFMSNMRVLSVGSQTERGPDGRTRDATTAALEVSPTEAEQLAVASNQGKIQLVLRGFGDPDTVKTEGASMRDINKRLNIPETVPVPAPVARRTPAPPPAPVVQPAPVVAAPARPRSDTSVVQIYRGSTAQEQKFIKRDTIKPPQH